MWESSRSVTILLSSHTEWWCTQKDCRASSSLSTCLCSRFGPRRSLQNVCNNCFNKWRPWIGITPWGSRSVCNLQCYNYRYRNGQQCVPSLWFVRHGFGLTRETQQMHSWRRWSGSQIWNMVFCRQRTCLSSINIHEKAQWQDCANSFYFGLSENLQYAEDSFSHDAQNNCSNLVIHFQLVFSERSIEAVWEIVGSWARIERWLDQ